MSRKVYDVSAVTGTYRDPRTGEDKNVWKRIGAVFENEKGLSIKLDTIPVGEWNGWATLFPPKPQEGSSPRPGPRTGAVDARTAALGAAGVAREDFDDGIPF